MSISLHSPLFGTFYITKFNWNYAHFKNLRCPAERLSPVTSENIISHDSLRLIFFAENIFLLIILEGSILMPQIFLK